MTVGQAYRGGCVIAYDHMNKRLKGLGFALVWNGYVVVTYYVPILAWVMAYFRHSFSNPLPWQGDHVNFYYNEVIANPDPIAREIVDGSVARYTEYTATGLIGETVGWCAFTWFTVCKYKSFPITVLRL
jgi:solute carrier family 6 GABA transporter-like protein 1